MFDANAGNFFKQWMRNPIEAGALSPSSHSLAHAMARLVDDDAYASVLELGGGTGAITHALLQNGVSAQRLVVMEKNPSMADALNQRFSDVRILQQDAARLWRLGSYKEDANFTTVISGLPMLLFGKRKQYAILKQAFGLLGTDGAFLQFTYGLSAPISRRVLKRLGVQATREAFIWRNAPPASVWRLCLIDQGGAQTDYAAQRLSTVGFTSQQQM